MFPVKYKMDFSFYIQNNKSKHRKKMFCSNKSNVSYFSRQYNKQKRKAEVCIIVCCNRRIQEVQ